MPRESIVFNSGRLTVTDSTFTLSPIVAKSPNFMAGGSERYRFTLAGDTLRIQLDSKDILFRFGDRLAAPSAPQRWAFPIGLVRLREGLERP